MREYRASTRACRIDDARLRVIVLVRDPPCFSELSARRAGRHADAHRVRAFFPSVPFHPARAGARAIFARSHYGTSLASLRKSPGSNSSAISPFLPPIPSTLPVCRLLRPKSATLFAIAGVLRPRTEGREGCDGCAGSLYFGDGDAIIDGAAPTTLLVVPVSRYRCPAVLTFLCRSVHDRRTS